MTYRRAGERVLLALCSGHQVVPGIELGSCQLIIFTALSLSLALNMIVNNGPEPLSIVQITQFSQANTGPHR